MAYEGIFYWFLMEVDTVNVLLTNPTMAVTKKAIAKDGNVAPTVFSL